MKKEMGVLGAVVVGAGALGNEVVWNLGQRGIGDVLCVDPDVVEKSNLGLARMFDSSQVGQPKASSLAAAASAHFPATRWTAFDGEIADLGWGLFERHDVIFGCVDRDSAHLEVARIATRLGIPVADGGLGHRGRVSYFPSRPETACFGCRLTAIRRRELLSTWRSQAFPCVEPTTETSRVSTVEQVRATAAMQVEAGLAGGAAMTVEIQTDGVTRFAMPVSEGCPFHGPPPPLVPFAPGTSLGWEWPICLRARCQSCNAEWQPLVRRARMKRCPACGGERILALECVDEMSAEADWTPGCIGLPEDHRYTVRVKQGPQR